MVSKLSVILQGLSQIHPNLVRIASNSKKRGFSNKALSAELVVEGDLDNTWLMSPPHKEVGDSFGTWPSGTTFPSGKDHIIPPGKEHQDHLPVAIPPHFTDEKMAKLMDVKSLLSYGKVKLPYPVFSCTSVAIDKKYSFHTTDFLTRKAMYEHAITDQLLVTNQTYLADLLSNLDSLDAESLVKTMRSVNQSLILALSSNQRCKQYLCSLMGSNKLAFRQLVLGMFVGNEATKEALKGSDLGSPDLFGQLPENLTQKVNNTAGISSHWTLSLASKDTSEKKTPSQLPKRSPGFPLGVASKKFKSDASSFSSGASNYGFSAPGPSSAPQSFRGGKNSRGRGYRGRKPSNFRK